MNILIFSLIGILMISGTVVVLPSVFAELVIKTEPDMSYQGEFWGYDGGLGSSGTPVGIVVEGDLQDNGYIKLILEGVFVNSSNTSYEQVHSITPGNPKHLFFLDYRFVYGQTYTLTLINGDAKKTVSWIPLPLKNEISEDDFRKLPAEEKIYSESMNVLGKVIRIFDDKICVEEYCQPGDVLPVHIEGNVGLNTKNHIKLQVIHCEKNYLLFCTDYPGLENMVVGEIPGENNGGGNFHADWKIRKNVSEGLYQIKGIVDGRIVGEVGDTMMSMVNGITNGRVIVVSNIEKLDTSNTTFVKKEDATITVLNIEYGQMGGIVDYEICAKRDLKNPAFTILSDSDNDNIVNDLELKKGECHQGRHTIQAKASATIIVPLATEKSTSSEEMDVMKAELAELRKMLEEKEEKTKVPGWIKNNVQWWADGQVDDQTFLNGIEFMVKEKVINIPVLPEQSSDVTEQKIPDWIRNNAIWWSEGVISEDDFVNGIEFLVQKGIVRVQ
jgi:hypothetical protein